MKRLLLVVALAFPSFGLYSCMTHVKVPTPATIIKEAHEAFPLPEVQIPELPADLTPPTQQAKPHATRRPHSPTVRKAQPSARPVPRPRPHVGQAEVETLPPQEGVICIFPFGLIPTCTPEPAGRMP